jgi:hypothetical protein
MQAVTTIGLDIAKSVFQVHGVDAAGQVLIRCQLKRRAVLAFFQKRALPDALVKKSQPLLSADSQREGSSPAWAETACGFGEPRCSEAQAGE